MNNPHKSRTTAKADRRRKQRQEPVWELAEEDIDTEETSPAVEAMRMIARWLVRAHKRRKQQAGSSLIISDFSEH
jgi:hypothetical protein